MKSKVDQEIIKLVQDKRLKAGVSKRALAAVIGTHHSFPIQVEDSESPCKYSADQLYYIAQYFDCPISEFFPDSDAFPSKLEKSNL